MAELGYLRAIVDSFGLVGLKTASRFGEALTDAENQKYTFEKATGDVLAFYDDLVAAWFGLASDAIVSPTPSVTMTIPQGTATATATVSHAFGTATVDRTDLFKIGLPVVPKIPKGDVSLTPSATDLKIDVKNLAAVKPGLYKGAVFKTVGNAIVLEIRLRVLP